MRYEVGMMAHSWLNQGVETPPIIVRG
jgi:hypothetical protein